ncbi:hypothetical protein EDC04DRAFT_2869165 [Pisolithus marmoratus]|nr:hypothetical protein EDC04DRAFT_2869165 [Pisolithus marmoratus]
MCILDILRHLLRSLFSDVQLQVILWGLSVLGVDNVPSTRMLKDIDSMLQSQYGIPSVRYEGALGHIYYINHLPSIIAQEMANPCVRPHICHYPKDARGRVDQPWQVARWLYEIDPAIAMLMIHKGQQDFYVFELTKLMDGTMVIPEHWYMKPSAQSSPPFDFEYWAHAWQAHPVVSSCTCLIEMRGCGVLPWVYTDPTVGNRWRMWAQGHHILSYMIWLYCDDTSGNMSTKWNNHNSFLFTAARLPCVMVHKGSGIHFLATSNIDPPLEMLDGIVDQLEHAQMHGIWAWDIEGREMVLVIPAILAMLGDNPMQRLQGGGTDSRQCPDLTGTMLTNADDDTHSIETGSHATDSDGSMHKDAMHQFKCKGCCSETMQDLVDRARCFLGVNAPHTRQDMMDKLHSMFDEVISGKDTGIKDMYMDVFIERILKHVKGIHAGTDRYMEAISAITQGHPVEEFMSPVWWIKGLDPHQDTPVEVLHIILLRFVKYFWHDAISRLNDVQKAELQVWLTSFNVSGLGFPPLAAQTLVQYAGSLTGRDFCAIAQAAPFILYDLVPHECYGAFLMLSVLVPLVWQPCIENIEEHLVALQAVIDHFLNCTARWTPQWFNKPNIHSNRQAPSQDIARGMARCHHVHHLLSGGKFCA